MTCPHTLQRLLICACLLGYPNLSAADMPSAERFDELLTAARGHVGSAVLVDAEEIRVRNRNALNFLFRTENSVLLSITLEVDTAAVLATSGLKNAAPKKPKNFLDRVAAFLGGASPASEQIETGAKPDVSTASPDDMAPGLDGPSPGRGNDPGRDRGGDRGGDQNGGPGNGNGRK